MKNSYLLPIKRRKVGRSGGFDVVFFLHEISQNVGFLNQTCVSRCFDEERVEVGAGGMKHGASHHAPRAMRHAICFRFYDLLPLDPIPLHLLPQMAAIDAQRGGCFKDFPVTGNEGFEDEIAFKLLPGFNECSGD